MDLIIIGGGAAGLTAAIYACRSGLEFLLLDSSSSMGSQLTQTDEIENYTGFEKIGGMELITKFRAHAKALGAPMKNAAVRQIAKTDGGFEVATAKESFFAKSVIFCGGASHRELGVKGEKEFAGKGVSYCAVCDGFFYRGKTVCVIGGGDTAVTEALYLSKFCAKVNVILRRDKFRAQGALVKKLEEAANVEIFYKSQLAEICGSELVERVVLTDGRSVETNGVFIAVGITPNSSLVAELAELNEGGYVVADEACQTSCEGLFVAGDVRQKPLRQVITACSDGANAVNSAVDFLNE